MGQHVRQQGRYRPRNSEGIKVGVIGGSDLSVTESTGKIRGDISYIYKEALKGWAQHHRPSRKG